MASSPAVAAAASASAAAPAARWSALVEVQPGRPGDAARPEASAVYRVAYSPDGARDMGVVTLLDMFERSVLLHGPRPCLGHRPLRVDGSALPFQFLTYLQVSELVQCVGSAYAGLGLKPGDRVGVLGANAPEWMMAMQAMNLMNLVCVPLYDTLGDTAVQYIIGHADTRLVVVAGPKLAAAAPALIRMNHVLSSGVVYWGAAPPAVLEELRQQGLSVQSWDDLIARGRARPIQPESRPGAEDLCTVMYTSGTTGDPKGVMISHRAVLSTISGIMHYLDHLREELSEQDVYLSFLPLAHIMDRVLEELMLSMGGSIGYFQGDVKKLIDDIGALRPTLFVGVPRVFERIYNGVNEQVRRGGWFKQLMFKWAYARKLYFMRCGWRYTRASLISDLLVFNKIKQRLGGRVRVIVSGGAPLSPSIEEFMRVCMCTPVIQGYGLTETCAASFLAHPYRMDHLGTVGAPLPQTELRLEAVPEMGYSPLSDPPAGEVLIRGPAVFSSYYKDEDMSRECIDAEGFFHTGDIGALSADGSLRIIDRKKNIFKLSHGEYIAVEKLEAVYKQCPLVEQIWVYGNSMESTLVAVVVPAEGPGRAWAQGRGAAGDVEALARSPAFKAHVLSQLSETGRSQGLKGFELIKGLHLEPVQFSVEKGLMTPKFSLKRQQLLQRYEHVVGAMYQELRQGEQGQGQGQGRGSSRSNPLTTKKVE